MNRVTIFCCAARTYRDCLLFVRFWGKADMARPPLGYRPVADDPKRTLGWTKGEYLPSVERAKTSLSTRASATFISFSTRRTTGRSCWNYRRPLMVLVFLEPSLIPGSCRSLILEAMARTTGRVANI